MKIARICVAISLLFVVAACNRQSSDPKNDIIGTWKSTDNKHMSLSLGADGTCLLAYSFSAPSDFETGTYTLTPDPSGINTLTLSLRRRTFGGEERSTRTYEAAVYADELILGKGATEIRLARAPKKTAP